MNIVRHLPESISKLHCSIYPIYAYGSFIYTRNQKYLDLTSGIGALGIGHSQLFISEAIKKSSIKICAYAATII